jgi:hypothetical protein
VAVQNIAQWQLSTTYPQNTNIFFSFPRVFRFTEVFASSQCSACYETTFITSRHCILSWDRQIKSTRSYLTMIHFKSVLSLRLVLSSLFVCALRIFRPNLFKQFFTPTIRATCHTHLLDLIAAYLVKGTNCEISRFEILRWNNRAAVSTAYAGTQYIGPVPSTDHPHNPLYEDTSTL